MKKFGKSRSGKKRKSIRFASCERRLNIVLDVTCENQRDFSAARRILEHATTREFFFLCRRLATFPSRWFDTLFFVITSRSILLAFLIVSSPFRSTRTSIIWKNYTVWKWNSTKHVGKLRVRSRIILLKI